MFGAPAAAGPGAKIHGSGFSAGLSQVYLGSVSGLSRVWLFSGSDSGLSRACLGLISDLVFLRFISGLSRVYLGSGFSRV